MRWRGMIDSIFLRSEKFNRQSALADHSPSSSSQGMLLPGMPSWGNRVSQKVVGNKNICTKVYRT